MKIVTVLSRGPRLLAAVLLLTLSASAAEARETNTQSSEQRPNIVVLLSDDLGWKDLGCYGGPVKTPALDRLAAEGVRFTDFHSGCTICSPSRATLLTGRQHIRAGVYSWISNDAQNSHLLEGEVTLAEILKDNGYATAHFGKWHLGLPQGDRKKPTPDKHGFDYWFATSGGVASPSHRNPENFIRNGEPLGKIEGYACQIVVDDAISWLDEKRDPDAPFFLNLWFHEPHLRVAAPDDIVSQYGKLDDQAAIYSGTIDNTDRAIARLLVKLEEVDSPENTLIVYSSDNGSYRADRVGNLRGKKGSNFEGGIRVPGIFYWPGTISKGRVEHEPAGLVDLLPTVCRLLGIDEPEGVHLDGANLSPLLTGSTDAFARRQPLFFLYPSSQPTVAIREGNYSMVAYRDYEFPKDEELMEGLLKQVAEVVRKANSQEFHDGDLHSQMFGRTFMNKEAERLRVRYVRLTSFQESWIPSIKAGGYTNFQLFDLVTDPGQQTDIAAQFPAVAAKLKKKLLEVNASVMDDAPYWE